MTLTERRLASAPALYSGTIVGDDGYPARFAVVRGARSPREVEAYLPDNYGLMESFEDEAGQLVAVIGGTDAAGWTLDDYVIPRLASGSMACSELPRFIDAADPFDVAADWEENHA